MKTIIAAMLSVSILSHAFAQDLPGVAPFMIEKHSRYNFEFENGNKLIVYARTVRDLQQFQNIDSTLALFLRDYKAIKPSLEENTNGQTAIYKPLNNGQQQLDLTEHKPTKQRFQFRPNSSEPLLLKTVQDTLLVIQNYLKPVVTKSTTVMLNERVYFYFIINSLGDIESLIKSGTANAHIKKALEDAKKYKGHDLNNEKLKFRYEQQNSLDESFKGVQLIRGDFLAIHQSFGVGVFQNQLVPNSQTEISLVPNQYHNIGYTLGWRSMFWTGRDEQTGRLRTNSNGVLQAGITLYDWNSKNNKLSRIDTDHVLFGIYLGRVMTRNGDIFERNTWNLSMTVAARGIVKIQPEVYFNGFFSRNVMPSLRVQVGF
jgi:hypothetical protein